jgi:hypothetical protein
VISPTLVCNFLVWFTTPILHFNIRLLLDTIQIFMQPIQQKGKKFLKQKDPINNGNHDNINNTNHHSEEQKTQ